MPVVVGGGPAGSAAAILLARNGTSPLLIERTTGPHDKLCGDFLSGEAVAALSELGVEVQSLGAAPIRTLRLVRNGRTTTAALPFPACGLSRRALDEALLAQARAAGAEVWRGRTVRRLGLHNSNLSLQLDHDETLAPEALFLATGKHDLRGASRPRGARRLIGLKTYFHLSPQQHAELGSAIELILLPNGYAGLQSVEAGKAVLCALISAGPGQPLTPVNLLDQLISGSAHLSGRTAGGHHLLPQPLTISGVPYGYVARAPLLPGLFRLGDQAAVIPSFAGAGLAIALVSAEFAIRQFRAGGTAPAYQQALRRHLRLPIATAGAVHRTLLAPGPQGAAFALSSVFPMTMTAVARGTRIRGVRRLR